MIISLSYINISQFIQYTHSSHKVRSNFSSMHLPRKYIIPENVSSSIQGKRYVILKAPFPVAALKMSTSCF